MITCSVPGCTSNRRNNPQKYTFHIFPLDVTVREKWVRMLHREGWVPKKKSAVCSKHFEKDCFPGASEQRVKLRHGSVPTLFMPIQLNTSHMLNDDITSLSSASGRRDVENLEKCLQWQTTATPHNHSFEGTMSEDTIAIQEVKKEMNSECRTCLQPLNSDEDLYYIFQSWVPPWEGVEDTIAEALQRIANIQLSDMDPHSKVICGACCQKLHMACLFANLAQQSDYTLWQRNASSDTFIDNKWPKPIQIDKNLPFHEQKEIKQEELSDEEFGGYSSADINHNNDDGMEIKIEPTELIPQDIPVEMNGHCEGMSPEGLTPEISVNGDDSTQEHYSVMVKEEPLSDNESVETDLSLDCMLCTKVFNSVSGLKAHVIAHHSYKSVRRKAANETSPVKKQKHEHICATCRRSFATSTDLMVHETCHNKSVCYGCNEKFDSFELVMQHRLTCKAVNNKEQVPLKTLEDVQRPQRSTSPNSEENTNDLLKCTVCGESFTDNYYLNIHLEIHHPVPTNPVVNEEEMEVEALECLFSERA